MLEIVPMTLREANAFVSKTTAIMGLWWGINSP